MCGLQVLGFPQLKAFVTALASMRSVAVYLEEMRMPRNGPHNGKTYPFKPGRKALHDEL